jgi:fluoride exporter
MPDTGRSDLVIDPAIPSALEPTMQGVWTAHSGLRQPWRQADEVPRRGWTWNRVGAIAAGGALGATCRWCVVVAAGPFRFPWPVLVVNIVGSFVLGLLLAEEPSHPLARLALQDLGAIGFCGGLTTFSTFAVEVVDLVDRGDAGSAALYGAASVAGSITALLAGAIVLRRTRALEFPVEERP